MLGELELLKLAPRGLNFYLIRTSKLFGPKGKSKFAKPGFFDIMLELAKTKNELKVVHDEMSCFTHTPDLAKATYELIGKKADFGIYHIVNEGPATWFDGVNSLFSLTGSKVNVVPIKMDDYPRPAKRPMYSVLKNTKFPKLRSYQEALKEYLNKESI
jgi:dTDP-4-dehydrorhamnose reductase